MSDFIVLEILDNGLKTNKQQKQKNKNEAGETVQWVKALAVQAQGTDLGFLETHTHSPVHTLTYAHTQTCTYAHAFRHIHMSKKRGEGKYWI